MTISKHNNKRWVLRAAICTVAAIAGLSSKQALADKAPIEVANMIIDVTGQKKNTGTIRVAIFDSKESWLKKPVFTAVLPADTQAITYSNPETPYGDYGVAVYHDVNDNDKMDRNFIGLPKEPYGFSNNARGSFGPPKWKKSVVSVSGPKTHLTIRIK